jgi:hypothetical protein
MMAGASQRAFPSLRTRDPGLDNIVRLASFVFLMCVAPVTSARAIEPGLTPLFNGRNLDGWEGVTSDASASWKVENGAIVCTGKPGTWLRSRERYADFNLRFDYRLLPGGNSGIYLRVPPDGAHREGGGVEVQLLDDAAERYRNIEPGQYCGSIYKVVGAGRHVSRPAGEWNTMEINCRGTSYRVIHNGVVIVDANEKQFPELKERFTQGYLGLQNHNEEVAFRNLRIGPPQDAYVYSYKSRREMRARRHFRRAR